MNEPRFATEVQEVSEVVEKAMTPQELLSYQQELWIDYNALGGLVINEDGELQKMSVGEFADRIAIDRTTLYRWRKTIPGFWDKVMAQRKILGSQARTVKVYNGLFLKASAGNPQAAAIFLANHDPDFRMPSQQVEHSAGDGFADLVSAMQTRKEREKQKPIEGEVVNADSTTSNA